MAADVDAIPPALTEEEWEEALLGPDDGDGERGPPRLRSMRSAAGDGVGFRDPAHASMALGNTALPDGHLGKITPLHVEALRRAAQELDVAQFTVGAIEVRVVADILAALLPSEPPRG